MPLIHVWTKKGQPPGFTVQQVPLCPDCRGTGKVIVRRPHSLRIHLGHCQRCH